MRCKITVPLDLDLFPHDTLLLSSLQQGNKIETQVGNTQNPKKQKTQKNSCKLYQTVVVSNVVTAPANEHILRGPLSLLTYNTILLHSLNRVYRIFSFISSHATECGH